MGPSFRIGVETFAIWNARCSPRRAAAPSPVKDSEKKIHLAVVKETRAVFRAQDAMAIYELSYPLQQNHSRQRHAHQDSFAARTLANLGKSGSPEHPPAPTPTHSSSRLFSLDAIERKFSPRAHPSRIHLVHLALPRLPNTARERNNAWLKIHTTQIVVIADHPESALVGVEWAT